MTGGRKNEQFDIVLQAQRIVDEYERKYFMFKDDPYGKEKRHTKNRFAKILAGAIVVIMFVCLWRMLS